MAPFATTIVVLVMMVLVVSFVVAASTTVRGHSRVRKRPHDFGVSSSAQGAEVSSGQDKALEELRLRYARGEISREEFLQRKIDLE